MLADLAPLGADRTGAPLRVLVADGRRMVAESLAAGLHSRPGVQVVGVAGSLAGALRASVELAPDVVVMDRWLPAGRGTDGVEPSRAQRPSMPIVMVADSQTRGADAAAAHWGCAALVTRHEPLGVLCDALRSAHAGGDLRSPQRTTGDDVPEVPDESGEPLTRRQVEVLQFLAEGWTTVAIAEMLVVSLSTVRNHVQTILRKLDAHSRLEAVTIGVKQGVVQYPAN